MPSSVIAKYSYDAPTEVLRVVYVSGSVYDYLHVPPSVYVDFKSAFSKGTYLNTHIKGRFDYKKIS